MNENVKAHAQDFLVKFKAAADVDVQWDADGNPSREFVEAFHRMFPALREGSCWPPNREIQGETDPGAELRSV